MKAGIFRRWLGISHKDKKQAVWLMRLFLGWPGA
jgi:hypothetical protein